VHIAETREQAFKNIEYGFLQWATYFASINPAGAEAQRHQGNPIENAIKDGVIVVGTPDDAIAQIRRLQAKQGEFGCFLQLAHNWANFDATKKSFDLWQRHVTPVINGANVAREEAFNWATDKDNSARFIGAAMGAAMQTIQKHHEDEARKAGAKAAE